MVTDSNVTRVSLQLSTAFLVDTLVEEPKMLASLILARSNIHLQTWTVCINTDEGCSSVHFN
jgi:hypothetical protein